MNKSLERRAKESNIRKEFQERDIRLKRFNPDSIKEIRDRLDISQSTIANLIETTPESIRNWEHSRTTPGGKYVFLLTEIIQQYDFKGIKLYY